MNDFPTKEISIHKGLKQGILLSHFIFLLALKDLNESLNIMVLMGIFKDFKAGS